MTLKHKYPTAEEAQAIMQQRLAAAQSDPRPAEVTQSEFIRRNMAADVVAGRCVVSIPHPFNPKKRLAVIAAREKEFNRWTLTFAEWEWEWDCGWFAMRVEWDES